MRKGKKSFNPFMMWGTYLGMLLMTIIGYFIVQSNYSYPVLTHPITIWYVVIPGPILGFFIGWGIHSLIRFLRR